MGKLDAMEEFAVLSVRMPAEMNRRLTVVARTLDLSKNDVARHAIRAALDAIEACSYQIEWPLKMNASPKIPDYLVEELHRLQGRERDGVLKRLLRRAREHGERKEKEFRPIQ